jgi:hypothetical protein
MSNLIGAIFSAAGFGVAAGFAGAAAFTAEAGGGTAFGAGDAAAFGRCVLATASLAITGLDTVLFGFTVTFDVAMGFAFVGGCTAFLGAATFGAAFLEMALPGRFAALLGFFEGIWELRLLTKERAIIPTQAGLYRPRIQHIFLF